jgi:hypothetical protein
MQYSHFTFAPKLSPSLISILYERTHSAGEILAHVTHVVSVPLDGKTEIPSFEAI